jgi:hypothetical protein
MAEPTMQDVFGLSVTFDGTVLALHGSDYASVGLTADINATAEAWIAAILKRAHNTLTAQAQTTNADQHVVIQSANSSVFESQFGTRLRHNLLVSFDNPFNDPGVTPDNY